MAFLLDRLDVQLMNIVQTNNQLTANELSERVPLSPSAVLRRLKRLRKSGVIEREVALLSSSFGRSRVSGVVHIQMKQHGPEVVAALKADLVGLPQVQLMFEISGTFDLMLLIVERDLTAFVAFTDDVLAGNPNVHRLETSFVKSRLKNSLAVQLDTRDAIDR